MFTISLLSVNFYPPMKFFTSVFLAVVALGLFAQAPAQIIGTDDAADQFFRGFVLKKDAETMEQEGNLQGALSLYQKMKSIFDAVGDAHPEWQPGMLNNRRALTDQAISRVQARLAQPAPVATPATIPMPAAATTAAPLFNQTPNGVPAPGALASSAATPSSGAIPSLSEVLAQWESTYRQRMTTLESQNTVMQGDLAKWQHWYEWASGEITTSRDKQKKLEADIKTKESTITTMRMEVAAGKATQEQLDTLTKEKIGIEVEYKKAVQRLAAAETAAAEARQKLTESAVRINTVEAERNKILAERDAAIQERDAKAAALVAAEKKTAEAEKRAQEANQKVTAVEKDRDAKSAQLLGLKTEIDQLKKRKPSELESESMKKLLAENDRLKKELESAQRQIVNLKSEATRKDQEIAKLRTEITTFQGEIAKLRQQSGTYQTQVADLTLQLKQLQEKKPADMPPEVVQDNAVLREIIMRQLRSQYRQQQARELVIAELKKMEGVSSRLLEQIEELKAGSLTLSPEEEKLFTDPSMRELLSSSGIQGTLIARISKTGDSADANGKKDSPIDDLLKKANEAFSNRQFNMAAGIFEDALRADPKNTLALVGLGYAREREQKYTEAETALKKCLLIDPQNESAAFQLGVTYFKQERLDDSMASFERGLMINPKNARGRHYLGIIATKKNFRERAEREFKSALALDPSYGEAHYNLAVLYATWDPPQWDKARTEYQEALKKGVTPDQSMEALLKGIDAPQKNTESKSVSAR
jgi:Flp pilus assembly protein TadD